MSAAAPNAAGNRRLSLNTSMRVDLTAIYPIGESCALVSLMREFMSNSQGTMFGVAVPLIIVLFAACCWFSTREGSRFRRSIPPHSLPG